VGVVGVLTVCGGRSALIVIDKFLIAVWLAASVTRTVNGYVPAVVGVPLMTPVVIFRERPGGRLPEDILQL